MRWFATLLSALLLQAPCGAEETLRFRQWMMGQEAGGMEIIASKEASGERIRNRQWTRIERKLDDNPATPPMVVEASQEDEALKNTDGSLRFSWTVRLSAEPLQGCAEWSPKTPGTLKLFPKNGSAQEIQVPAGALLWPGDADVKLLAAAKNQQAIHILEYSFSGQQWAQLDAEVVAVDPLPGFPDAVRFHGKDQSGPMIAEVDLWVSPKHGEVKRLATIAGLQLLMQRTELPAPSASTLKGGFFERTLAKLPSHPFLPWIPEATLRWKGKGPQELPEDDQQKKLGENLYRVKRAALPTLEEAHQAPVKEKPSEQEASFLAASPLVPFQDPVFDGLLKRLNPPAGATRWELSKLVTNFVYDWITDKDLSVGFASALEVARTPRGDCTEHGVLAVALLRRLGVPARGVVGWVGLENLVGLHFWVEVKLKDRWVPVDPTFDQVPASALRLKMGTTDLADLGSLGWDTAALSFVDGTWTPEKPWTESVRVDADCVIAPEGTLLRMPGARWILKEGVLQLRNPDAHEWEACIRPDQTRLKGARLLMGSRSGRKGWWHSGSRLLWMEAGEGRWLQVSDCSDQQAFQLLDELEVRAR